MGIGQIGVPGLLLIAVVVLVLFGRGKVSSLMGEVGKGITAFKRGVSDGAKDDVPVQDQALADGTAARNVTPEAAHDRTVEPVVTPSPAKDRV